MRRLLIDVLKLDAITRASCAEGGDDVAWQWLRRRAVRHQLISDARDGANSIARGTPQIIRTLHGDAGRGGGGRSRLPLMEAARVGGAGGEEIGCSAMYSEGKMPREHGKRHDTRNDALRRRCDGGACA